MPFKEESRHQTRNCAPSPPPRSSKNDGREHGTSSPSISQSISYDVHPAERPSPSTLRNALAAGHRRSLSQTRSLNQCVDLMGSDLAPAASEQGSTHSNPVRSFNDMGQSSFGSRRAENSFPDPEPSFSQDSSLEKQRSGLPSRGFKVSTVPSRDSWGDPPAVFENPEASSPGRSVRSSRSMRSVSPSPTGCGPKFAPEFDYLTKTRSKQSGVDADPMKITVSTPTDSSKISTSNEVDQGQSSRDQATRVNTNFDDIEPKPSCKSSSPPGEHLQKRNPFVIYCICSHHHLPYRFCSQHGRL
jgi:hypothetical protein